MGLTDIQSTVYVYHVCTAHFTASLAHLLFLFFFERDVPLISFSTLPPLDLSLNPVPFAIDVHWSIFACVWAYFGKTTVTLQKKKKQDCEEKAALPLVAAVAAETPQRKWGIGHTLIQFTINKTLLDAGP